MPKISLIICLTTLALSVLLIWYTALVGAPQPVLLLNAAVLLAASAVAGFYFGGCRRNPPDD